MTTILLYIIEEKVEGILENLEELTEQNTVEELTSFKIFWNMKEKPLIYQAETDVFSSVLIRSSEKILPKNIMNSYNHIKEN